MPRKKTVSETLVAVRGLRALCEVLEKRAANGDFRALERELSELLTVSRATIPVKVLVRLVGRTVIDVAIALSNLSRSGTREGYRAVAVVEPVGAN